MLLMNRLIFLILAVCLFQARSIAQQPKKVRALFLGNSYVTTNNLPLLIKNAATSVGDTLLYAEHCPGGYTFSNHLYDQVSQAQMNEPQWDYVIIQQQSVMGAAICNDPYNISPNAFEPNNLQSVFDLKMLIDAEGATPMLYMTWGRKNGEASLCAQFPQAGYYCTYQGMDSLLQKNYMQMAGPNMWYQERLPVAAVAAVWRFVRTNHPEIELYSSDGSHPSLAGSYLAACTFYNMLFRKSALGINYNPGLPTAAASNIRLAVNQVIHSNLQNWNVGYYDPAPDFNIEGINPATSTVSFKNESNKLPLFGSYHYQNFKRYKYRWSFGDGGFSDEPSPTHTFSAPGDYLVTMDAAYKNGSFPKSVSRMVRIGGPLIAISAVAENELETTLTSNDSLSFPTILVGDTMSRIFHVYNHGTQPLTINQVEFGGNSAWSYTLDSTTINPGRKAVLIIRFHPVAGGVTESLLSILSNDNVSGTYYFNLSGKGIGQNQSFEVYRNNTIIPDESSIDYGNPSAPQEIETLLRLKNTGNMPLKIKSIFITGDTAAFYAAGRSMTLNPGNSQTIPVILRVRDTLSSTAFLNISTNHSGNPLYRIQLSTWQQITSRQKELQEERLSIYPNPAGDELNVSLRQERISGYRLTDLQGRKVTDKHVSATHFLSLKPLRLAPGIYQMEVTSESGKKYKSKVVKLNN
jgi:PKD repeat protein